MIAPISYIQPLTTLRRKRELPAEGVVLVNMGDIVHSGDAVARANIDSKHVILDAGHALGLPAERAMRLIQRNVGDKVEEGAIIAGRRGVGTRLLRAPASGTIAAISEGQVLLEVTDESTSLRARVPGHVVAIEPNLGVTIECVCAWVQGVWGNGGLADGFLQLVGQTPNQVLTADQIDMSLRGTILLAGSCPQRQTLELAAQVPIRGLVLGSLAIRLLPIAQKMPYPIMLTEGFGTVSMNADAFKLFSNHSGKPATLNAQEADPNKGHRPEVIIPIKDAGRPPQPVAVQSFRIGQSVRILSGASRGQIGEITAMLPTSTLYPSGLRAASVEVSLPGGRQDSCPLANLELLG
ncbi:MAG: hypothetical protein WEA61_00800 [Anaerolineales bacterium]